jgi:hypothetical protein
MIWIALIQTRLHLKLGQTFPMYLCLTPMQAAAVMLAPKRRRCRCSSDIAAWSHRRGAIVRYEYTLSATTVRSQSNVIATSA